MAAYAVGCFQPHIHGKPYLKLALSATEAQARAALVGMALLLRMHLLHLAWGLHMLHHVLPLWSCPPVT